VRRRRVDFDRLFGRRRCQSQEFAHSRDRLGAVGAGERAVVADAMEAFGQNVDEEPTDDPSTARQINSLACRSASDPAPINS
jgi:hypothetical protein